jgi:hypothetical protein
MDDDARQKLLSASFHDVETIVGGHAMRPLSLASYDVLLRTANPLVKGDMPARLLRRAHPGRLPGRVPPPRGAEPATGGGTGGARAGTGRKKAPPCDEPGFLAAQVFALAAETGWPEERILHMPLARLAQFQHCLLRRNGVRTHWSRSDCAGLTLREQMEALRGRWADNGPAE